VDDGGHFSGGISRRGGPSSAADITQDQPSSSARSGQFTRGATCTCISTVCQSLVPSCLQYLINAPEGFARLVLEHKARPTAGLRALFALDTTPEALVRSQLPPLSCCWLLCAGCCDLGSMLLCREVLVGCC
jgi:hypothetical protein